MESSWASNNPGKKKTGTRWDNGRERNQRVENSKCPHAPKRNQTKNKRGVTVTKNLAKINTGCGGGNVKIREPGSRASLRDSELHQKQNL